MPEEVLDLRNELMEGGDDDFNDDEESEDEELDANGMHVEGDDDEDDAPIEE